MKSCSRALSAYSATQSLKDMRFDALSIFRFIAAIIVIVQHYGQSSGIPQGLFTAGSQMVTFFFVLSGFVMMFAYFKKDNFSAKIFYIKRIKKFYPLYLFSLIIVVILNNYYYLDLSLLLSLLALQAWFPPHPLDLNFPAWFISVGVAFYAMFPTILYILKRRDWNPYHIILASLFIWTITQIIATYLLNSDFYQGPFSTSHQYLLYFPPIHFCSFAVGVAGGYLILKRPNISTGFAYLPLILASLGIYWILGHQHRLFGLAVPYESSFLAPAFSLFIISVVINRNTCLSNFLSKQLFVLLGEASFALYILQKPIHDLFYDHWGLAVFGDCWNFYVFLIADIIISIIICILINCPLPTRRDPK